MIAFAEKPTEPAAASASPRHGGGGSGVPVFTRPLSASLLGAALLLVVIVMLPSISKKREATFQEE